MKKEMTLGVVCAAAAYTLWGILPLYWKLLNNVFSIELLAHRIIWAFVFLLIISIGTRQWEEIRNIAGDKKQIFFVFISAILITFNWGLFIWAVNSNQIVDASLGYYINPLIAVLLGVVIFKEKLNLMQVIALSVALIGVIILTVEYGKFPWVSVGLALSFGLYGAMKKLVKAKSIAGLTLETVVIAPVALVYIVLRQSSGQGSFGGESIIIPLLIIGTGVVTAVPLLLFAEGAKRIPLSTLGFTQYISPTLMFIFGVFVYHESFKFVNAISFGFIWFAIFLYSVSNLGLFKRKGTIAESTPVENKIQDVV